LQLPTGDVTKRDSTQQPLTRRRMNVGSSELSQLAKPVEALCTNARNTLVTTHLWRQYHDENEDRLVSKRCLRLLAARAGNGSLRV